MTLAFNGTTLNGGSLDILTSGVVVALPGSPSEIENAIINGVNATVTSGATVSGSEIVSRAGRR